MIFKLFLVINFRYILPTSFSKFNANKTIDEQSILQNDPLYQTVPTRLPSPWNKTPMFQIDGDKLEEIVPVDGM